MDWLPALIYLTSPQIIVSRILAPVINIHHGCLKTNNFPYLQIDLFALKISLTMAWLDSQAMLPIFKRLDLHSLISCTATCKTWYNYLALDNFFDIEVIIHLVERFNGDVVEWQSFLKRSTRTRQIKVNRWTILKEF